MARAFCNQFSHNSREPSSRSKLAAGNSLRSLWSTASAANRICPVFSATVCKSMVTRAPSSSAARWQPNRSDRPHPLCCARARRWCQSRSGCFSMNIAKSPTQLRHLQPSLVPCPAKNSARSFRPSVGTAQPPISSGSKLLQISAGEIGNGTYESIKSQCRSTARPGLSRTNANCF